MKAKITEAEIERVCDALRTSPGPFFGAKSLNRARDEAIRLIYDLRDALAAAEKQAQNVESSARAELERCLPGYVWPGTNTAEPDSPPPVVDPLASFQSAAETREVEVTALYDKSDHHLVETRRILAPGIAAMKELEFRLSGTDGVNFCYGVAGHMVTVTLNTSAGHESLTLQTDLSLRIIVEEYQTFSFDSSGPFEKKKPFSTVDEAVAHIAEACGRHVGAQAALRKRPPRDWSKQDI